ncbi:hypothetical protein HC752_21935 [Vibrio sp. S9_S30]|uniref:hypothetical protein n=1 Tax=Vibrio sp. S9_S30 TaxID=2720226 RepID=UPI001681B742|nr:hypothetical protein [Vibrio sp. S9_S30]MBD1559608.1 hypothetical protein [Vibrio sp. S9_S30]
MTQLEQLRQRLTEYESTEREILKEGQKVRDEDDRELQRASLKQVQDGIRETRSSIARLTTSRKPRTRQYRPKV